MSEMETQKRLVAWQQVTLNLHPPHLPPPIIPTTTTSLPANVSARVRVRASARCVCVCVFSPNTSSRDSHLRRAGGK